MPVKKEIVHKDPQEIEEVAAFLKMQDQIAKFREAHAAVFAEYESLVEQYNASLQNAEKVVRAKEIACGPFHLYQYAVKYDAKALFDAVGRDRFLALGGSIGTEATYTLDKQKFDIAAAQAKIDEEIVAQVRKATPNYHKPTPLVVT